MNCPVCDGRGYLETPGGRIPCDYCRPQHERPRLTPEQMLRGKAKRALQYLNGIKEEPQSGRWTREEADRNHSRVRWARRVLEDISEE